MPRKKATLFSLKQGKIRQSWNKYNLYNLSEYLTNNRKNAATKPQDTYFQQKWRAKAILRAYHGEPVLEKHWRRQFVPILRSVTPMDPAVLARSDGREESAGRGSGLDVLGADMGSNARKKTPHTNLIFAALERRLDVAIHRAMFASSTRQARQFVIHGFVKVNGKRLTYPGYQLNPGDLFQVDVDRVLYATGAPKSKEERRETRRALRQQKADEEEAAEATEEAGVAEPEAAGESESAEETLKAILDKARDVLATEKDSLPAKRKRLLRGLQRSVRRAISRGRQHGPIEEAVDEQMLQLMRQLNVAEKDDTPSADSPSGEQGAEATATAAETGVDGPQQQWMSPSQKRELERALTLLKNNPVDLSKPYATPWSPRPYMSPFAFIPRYLEVQHSVCSAIYLRHPVARPGEAEVPTPFVPETSSLAFNWYLRNR